MPRRLSAEEWERRLGYLHSGMTHAEIAQREHVSRTAIATFFSRWKTGQQPPCYTVTAQGLLEQVTQITHQETSGIAYQWTINNPRKRPTRKLKGVADEELLGDWQKHATKELVTKYQVSYSTIRNEVNRRLQMKEGIRDGKTRKSYIHSQEAMKQSAQRFWLRDTMILEGCTPEQIKVAEGANSRQVIDSYIRQKKLRGLWEEAKELQKDTLPKILRGIEVLIEQRRDALSQAEQYALRYLEASKFRKRVDRKKLLHFFERYVVYQQAGEKVTLRRFSEETNVSIMQVNRMLDRIGLPTIGYRRIPYNAREQVKERDAFIREIYERTVFGKGDIASMLGLTDANMNRILKKHQTRHNRLVDAEVYEAADAGFSVVEISTLVKKSLRKVEEILEQRPVLEQKLIDSFRVVTGDASYHLPYLTSAHRQVLYMRFG